MNPKTKDALRATKKIMDGHSKEETIPNMRDDLEKYEGTNDITFILGKKQ